MASVNSTDSALTELTELFNTLTTKASHTTPTKMIKLNVGGRIFTTSPDTLRSESGLFSRQLSDRFTWTPDEDETYFLDADPDLFAHLLQFMRRPSVFPLFYNNNNNIAGFDYNLYNRLEAEAEYFQIDALHKWIKEKKYHQAIQTQTDPPLTRNIQQIGAIELAANKSVEWHVLSRARKVYLCPRMIPVHRGRPEMCGAACRKAQEGHAVEYEEEAYLEVFSVAKEIVFNESVCRVDC